VKAFTSLHDIVIDAFDPLSMTDAQICEQNVFWNAIRAEQRPEDPPTLDEIAIANLRNTPSFVRLFEFAARTSGDYLVGVGGAAWTETGDNEHLVSVEMAVLEPYRRKGIGRELLRRVIDVADKAGRTLLIGWTNERVPAGSAFARRLDAQAAQEGHTNRLLLADVDREMVARWLAEGPSRAPGYSLISVDGPYPDDLVEAITDLHNVMNTAPRDNLDVQDHDVTVEEVREGEKGLVAAGIERWYIAARHDATGQLVGFTELFWNGADDPTSCWQGGTAVRPEHRGHALGKWLKAANIERLMNERPDVVEIRTGNADSNDAMLGINKELGFKPYYGTTAWQVTVDKVKEYLDG
jgi:mycothiol synthase